MPRRQIGFRKVQALGNPEKLEQLTALEDIKINAFPDPAADIVATAPEKMVYNYLARLGIRFYFQYYSDDISQTFYTEDNYRPDFYLPDYNTVIEVFGTYWHSAPLGTFYQLYSERRIKDIKKMNASLFAGKEVIEHGIPTMRPQGGGMNGKYVIWWEEEIYFDLGHLFARDLPELLSPSAVHGKPEESILDRERELERKRSLRARMSARKLRPRLGHAVLSTRRLRRRIKDLTKQYPLWRRVVKDVNFRLKKI